MFIGFVWKPIEDFHVASQMPARCLQITDAFENSKFGFGLGPWLSFSILGFKTK